MNPEQTDVSIKHLLKQVYSAHVTKVKGLDEEIEELKNKLLEADRKVKQRENDCKRCAELEEAFKSCKAALHEQSKWFENLGQKFSVFDSSENKTLSKNTRSLSLDGIQIQADIALNQQLPNIVSEKSSANGQDIFRNLMSLNSGENQDSLDLCSVQFPQHFAHDYSTLNSDSLILAPDTVDISDANSKHSDRNKKVGSESLWATKTKMASVKDSKEFSENINTSGNVIESKETNRQTKKRSLTESSYSEKDSKRLSKDSVADVNFLKSATKQKSEVKSLDPRSQVDHEKTNENLSKVATNSVNKRVSKEKPEVKTLDPQNSNDASISSIVKSVNTIDAPYNCKKKKNQTLSLDVQICKDSSGVHQVDNLNTEKRNVSLTKEDSNVIPKNNQSQASPSLLPLNKSSKPVFDEQVFVPEDICDFQSPILNKKQIKDDGTWTACDKKKLKKCQPMKFFKSNSKFKMHLDSLPPNYKKPNYRQTKLSQSIFQPKASTSSSCTNTLKVLGDYNISSSSEESDHISTPFQRTVKTKIIDFDATCIPDNYEIIPSGSINREISNENFDSVKCVVDVDINIRSNGSSSTSPVCKKILKQNVEKSDSKDAAILEDFISNKKETVNNEHLNSFDRLPKKEEPNYKYKEETVRKKAERKQLNGFDCKECENYYSELGLSDKEKQERLKKCSRHRAKYAPPATPEHFWELEFPDTQECKARGYLNETQKVKLKSHRRRPLDL